MLRIEALRLRSVQAFVGALCEILNQVQHGEQEQLAKCNSRVP